MKIEELFLNKVTRDIAPVVYFEDRTPKKLQDEVDEYIITGAWPPEHPNYAHFAVGSGAVFAIQEAEGRGGRFNFTVDDPDELWRHLRDRVRVVEALFTTEYGTRKFTIADPDGNELGFVDHVA